jgi:hypothetical protein
MEHLSTDFGNLGLSSSRGGVGGSSSAGEWPRQQPVPPPQPRTAPTAQYQRTAGFRGSNSNANMAPSVLRSGSNDWQQLESDLNAATAKEFVPGHGWNTQQQQQLSSASSVGSNSQGESESRQITSPLLLQQVSISFSLNSPYPIVSN